MARKESSNLSRAEQVRARRKIENTLNKPPQRQTGKTTRKAPPPQRVTSRQVGSSNARKAPSGYAYNRRKVYMQLDTPGAEIRLPSIPNIQFGWRLASLILAAAMLFVVYAMREMPTFSVSELKLQGATRFSAEEIANRLDIIDSSIVEVIPAEVEQAILAEFSDIKSAEVDISLPAMVTVRIEERIPAVMWIEEDGQQSWIDQDGYMFPVKGEATLPVPVQAFSDPPSPPAEVVISDETQEALEQTVMTPQVNPDFVNAILSLRDAVPEGAVLRYDAEYGLGWQDPQGWLVYFGSSTDQFDVRLAQYNVIIQELQAKNIQPALISLEFLHAPFYRLEQ